MGNASTNTIVAAAATRSGIMRGEKRGEVIVIVGQ